MTHIYIHVPFCARRCSYCDFSIAVRRVVPDRAFVDCVLAEWEQRTADRRPAPIDTLYFGGGTPSRLDPAALAELIGALVDSVGLSDGAEITIEVNPDDVTVSAVKAWQGAGANRVSLGVQSHDPVVLDWMHRTHHADQVAPAIAMLRDGGVDNISTDLIFALPTALGRDWESDVTQTLALRPSHVSLYGLTVEPRTALARWTERGSVRPTPDDVYALEYLAVHAALRDAGFEHYEVSNAALPGMRSRHNSAYWSGASYLGLGPSAHSFAAGVRSWNVRDWESYRAGIVAGRPAQAGFEVLDADARRLESAYLGLRTDAGLERGRIAESTVAAWVSAGWAGAHGDRIRLTAEGWLRLDALVAGMEDS